MAVTEVTEVTEVPKYNLLEVSKNLLATSLTLKRFAEELNVSQGTIKRWIELNDIPRNYEFDILKLSNIPIVYTNYTTKDKDQYFTPLETAQNDLLYLQML